jgi:hypothetical protein
MQAQARCIVDQNGQVEEPCMPQTILILDSSGHRISGSVKTGQQIQIIGTLTNYHDTNQTFVYLEQIQDPNGVNLSLSWITGTLAPNQSFNPAQSWITPAASGTYVVAIFFWPTLDNPNNLQPPESTTINVQ